MAAPLLGNAALYPTITVSMGVTTASSGFAVWAGSAGGSLFNTGLWGPDVSFVDVTSYVRQVSTTRGRSRDQDRFVTGSMSIVLSNGDSRFSPANITGPYVTGGVSQIRPGVVFKIEATWAGVKYPVFYGEADSWDDSYVDMGKDGITTVTVLDALAKLSVFEGLAQTAQGAGELAGARIAVIAINAGFDGPLELDAGINTMQATTLSGNALQEIGLTADSDGGYVWADASGALVYFDQYGAMTHPRSNTSQFTFGTGSGEVYYEGADPSYDSTLIFNTVSFARVGGATYTTVATDSVALYKKPLTYRRTDLICQTDFQASTMADFFLSKYRDAEYRIASMQVQPAANPAVSWPLVLGALLRDRVTGKIAAPGGMNISAQLFVDGVSHQIDSNGWRTSFNFSSAAAYASLTEFGTWNAGTWDTSVWFV
jgi:hypothetical protein